MADAIDDLFRRFGKAFNKADVEEIAACVTDDFEWRLNAGGSPSGTVLKGKEFSAVAMDQAAAVNLPSASGFAQSRRLRMASSTSASASLACRASASATSARSSTAVNLSF